MALGPERAPRANQNEAGEGTEASVAFENAEQALEALGSMHEEQLTAAAEVGAAAIGVDVSLKDAMLEASRGEGSPDASRAQWDAVAQTRQAA